MSEEAPEVKPDATPSELAKTRLPETLPPSEREVYEGKISELEEELAKARDTIAELRDKARERKKETKPETKPFFDRFSPL